MIKMVEFLYIRSNKDLIDKVKFGFVGSQENGLKNRLKSSITELSYYSKYEKVYGIVKEKTYNSYKEFDKIFSIDCKKHKSTGYPLLDELKKYICNNRPLDEFIYKEGIPLIEKIVDEVFPLLGLTCVKKFTEEELRELEKLTYEEYISEQNKITHIRDYQLEIINYLEIKLKQDKKIYLELATGGGKSFIVYNIINLLNVENIIIFSPRIKINQQNINSKYLDIIDGEKEIYKDKKLEGDKTKKIYCFCIQNWDTAEFWIKKYNLTNCFVWFDEAHYKVEKNIDNFFLIDDKHIKYRIFTSASPSSKISENKNIFGEHYKPVSIKELKQEKWLCDLECRIIDCEDASNINLLIWNIKNFEKEKKNYGFSFHSRDDNAFSLFLKHYELYIKKTTAVKPYLLIQYKPEIKEKLKTITLDYDYQKIEDFEKNKICGSIAYVVKKYDMGYDFKDLDYIIFSDPKTSEKDIIQCIGRGLRSDGKDFMGRNLNKKLLIMLPTSNKESNFNKIIEVLRYIVHNLNVKFDETKHYKVAREGCAGGEITCSYEGVETDKSKLLELLYENNLTNKINTRKLIEICRKEKIYDEKAYGVFKKKFSYLNLKNNICEYDNFKWKLVVDSEGKIYYATREESEKRKIEIYDEFKNKESGEEYKKFLKLINLRGYIELNRYDCRLPPYNDLKTYY